MPPPREIVQPLLSAVLAVVVAAFAVLADQSTRQVVREFRNQTVSIEIPANYQEQSVPSPSSSVMVLGFTGSPRGDDSRPMVEVSLMDLAAVYPRDGAVSLADFGERMIKGVERRREQWKVDSSDSEIGSIRVKKYEWSGVASPSKEARAIQPVRMRGVMYAGIQSGIGFILHSQDTEEFAREALPIGEKSLRTFRFGAPPRK
jgi:hypothetical protein